MRDRHAGAVQLDFAARDGTRLAGTLTLPPGAGPFPAVVAVHAARAGVRDALLHRHLMTFLPQLGVAVFIYDRRGEGDSDGRPGAQLGVLASDARAALSVIVARPDVHADHVGIWAHSQGGWIAPIAAAGCAEASFLIVVAGSGVSPHEQMIFATANLMREAGFGQDEVARATHFRQRLHTLWQDRQPMVQAWALLHAASREPWFGLTYLPGPGSPPGDLRDAASFEADLDIAPVLARLRIPVLLVYGETDRWVPIDASINVWRTMLSPAAPLRVARLPGCGHFPTLADDPADVDEAGPVAAAYEHALAGWLATIVPGLPRMKSLP